MINKSRKSHVPVVILRDLLSLSFSFLLSYVLYLFIKHPNPVRYVFINYLVFSICASAIIIGVFYIRRIYYTRYFLHKILSVYRIIKTYSVLFLIIFIVLFFTKKIVVPRLLLIIIWGIGLSSLLLPRLILPYLYRLHSKLNVLYISDGTYTALKEEPGNQDFKIECILAGQKSEKEIGEFLKNKGVDILIANTGTLEEDSLARLFLICEEKKIDFFYNVNEPFMQDRLYSLRIWEGIPFLSGKPFRYQLSYALAKRIIDIVIAIILLPALAATYLYLLIRTGEDPVAKMQIEGYKGKCFPVYYFKGNPGSISHGMKFFPSILNILKGQLTFIGIKTENYKILHRSYKSTELSFKPAVIGMGDIFNSDLLPLFDDFSLDLNYAMNSTIIMDFSILIFFMWMRIKKY